MEDNEDTKKLFDNLESYFEAISFFKISDETMMNDLLKALKTHPRSLTSQNMKQILDIFKTVRFSSLSNLT